MNTAANFLVLISIRGVNLLIASNLQVHVLLTSRAKGVKRGRAIYVW